MASLALHLLGPPRVELDGRPLTLNRRKVLALLVYLALTRQTHRRDHLATLFWSGYDQTSARTNLRRALSTLNQALRKYWLQLDGEEVTLKRNDGFWLDVDQFHSLIASCAGHDHAAGELCPACLEALSQAAALYRDDLLTGFTLPDSPEFDDWQLFQTESLRRELVESLEKLVRGHSVQGQLGPAIAYARRWLTLDPLRELAHRQLMRLLTLAGQRNAALAQYDACCQILNDELGVEPTAETTALYEQIRKGELTAALTPQQPSPPVPQHNLPEQTTPFLGREEEVAELTRLLAVPELRLITILGPGGIGKTRLAQETAGTQLDNFVDGVYLVSLAAVESPDSIVPTIAAALNFSFYEGGNPRQQLLDYLRSKRLLLILDNFEHLLSGVDLVTGILRTAPGVKILATSRERLRLQDEQLFQLAGIDFPTPEAVSEDIADYSAIKLFLQSARRVQPGFELASNDLAAVADICRLARGMPLAILLAAGWVELLTPAEIAAELGRRLDFLETDSRDVPVRHQSMRAVFDHSWRLLSESEREIFQQLSVFWGGFTRQAAQEVAGASLRSLRRLLNKSLLEPASLGRYQVHELLRQYAAEILAQTPSAYRAARDRHAAHYAAILNEWESDFNGPRQQLALAELEKEIENVRVAWQWAVDQNKIADLAHALESLYQFYWGYSRFREGHEAFSQAVKSLQAPDSRPSETVLARLLARQGAFSYALGLHDSAGELLRTSLALARRLNAKKEIAFSLRLLGDVAWARGEYTTTKQRYQHSLTISQESMDQAGIAAALFGLGWVSHDLGEHRQARDYYQQCLALYRTLDDQKGMARVLDKLGIHTFAVGQYRESEQFYRESLAIFKKMDDRFGVALALGGLGLAAWVEGGSRLPEAKQLLEESLAICREIGHRVQTVINLGFLGQVHMSLEDDEAAQQCLGEAMELAREISFQIGLTFSLNGLGEAACRLRDFHSATQYLFEALTIALESQDPINTLETLLYWTMVLTKDDNLPAAPDASGTAWAEHALELLALVSRHPATWQFARDKAARLVVDLEIELSPEIVAAAQARGQARDLWTTAEEVLAKMKARSARDKRGQSKGAKEQRGKGEFASTSLLPPSSANHPARPSAPQHNLPSSPTPLVGREKEVAEIDELLADPNCRLVTITGPGGIGKTRLALGAARQVLPQFADGVYFVALASTDSAEDIVPRMATALDPEAYPAGQVAVDFLPGLYRRDPALLLVLDNLEQLLPDGISTIEELLTQTRRLKLLVTSRQALKIRWEWRCDLDGLTYPAGDAADALESYSAVEMFLQRLRQTRREPLSEADLQAVARICRLVGGMPLGIELAAAQAGRSSCTAIAAALEHNLDALVVSLRDLPARQRSLRASFEMTWANLSPDEQAIFRRLSLFRSSFTAAAAQAVAEAGPIHIANLMDKSLLRQASPERYDLHEVLRHFAQEKLAEVPSEQAQALIRYRSYYTALLHERAAALVLEADLTDNIAAIHTEIDNLWAGWVQVTGRDDAQEFASALVTAFRAVHYAQFLLKPDSLAIIDHQQQLLENRSSEADVCLIDLSWTDTLADHLLDSSEDFGDLVQHHFPIYIEHSTVKGRLVALPFSANLGALYYRSDLLAKYGFAQPPATWDELELMAAEIQAGERAKGRTNFWGFIWPGENYEGLTCTALEWQVSHGSRRLIEPEGLITVNNPQTITAFERAARWVGTISPVSVTETGLGDEAANLRAWLTGNVAFMRSWTDFLAELAQNSSARDQTGITFLPSAGAGPAATLGGRQIAISKYARHPREAIELVRYAAGREAQLQRNMSPPFVWLPTIPDLYDHPQLLALHPHLPQIREFFAGDIVVRPSKVCGPLYPQVSKAYSTAVHSILTGQVEAGPALAELEARLVELTGFETGVPTQDIKS